MITISIEIKKKERNCVYVSPHRHSVISTRALHGHGQQKSCPGRALIFTTNLYNHRSLGKYIAICFMWI